MPSQLHVTSHEISIIVKRLFLSSSLLLFFQLYPDDEADDETERLANAEEQNQSSSAIILEKLSGKRLTFKDTGKGSKGEPSDDDLLYMKTPSKEKSANKRLPATQVRVQAYFIEIR